MIGPQRLEISAPMKLIRRCAHTTQSSRKLTGFNQHSKPKFDPGLSDDPLETPTPTLLRHTSKSFIDDPFEAVPSSLNNNMIMTWSSTEFDQDGHVAFVELSRNDLHHKLKLNSRDLRLLVSNFNYPAILSREKCIIIDISDIHCIITADKMYLLRMRDEELDSTMVLEIQHAIKNKKEYSTYSMNTQPFELHVLEVLLDRVNESVEREYSRFTSQYKLIVDHPDLAISEEKLHELLQLKHRLNRLSTFIDEVYNSISTLLSNDQDMANMYLTNKTKGVANNAQDHEEVEMLLETYFSQFEDCMNRTKEIILGIKSTQDFLSVSLDSVRNKMMQVELKLGIASFAVSVGTFIVGIFGMNLISYLEQTPYMFPAMTFIAVTLIGIIFRSVLRMCNGMGLFKTSLKRGFVRELMRGKHIKEIKDSK
jgi:magnesium transporter